MHRTLKAKHIQRKLNLMKLKPGSGNLPSNQEMDRAYSTAPHREHWTKSVTAQSQQMADYNNTNKYLSKSISEVHINQRSQCNINE